MFLYIPLNVAGAITVKYRIKALSFFEIKTESENPALFYKEGNHRKKKNDLENYSFSLLYSCSVCI